MSATVNGVAIEAEGFPSAAAAAAHELLRQRAIALGLAAADDGREAVDRAIERLLEREVVTPEPGGEECRRYYDAHPAEFRSGELAFARHILFQVTPGTPVPALRARAELVLAELAREPSRLEAYAREYSNCPSGGQGGSLGQLQRGETVPEFEQALFNGAYTGIYPQLVKTRFGFHILAVDRREPGRHLPFDAVQVRIAERLREHSQRTALAQYVKLLAGAADVRGVDLAAAATPLVQ